MSEAVAEKAICENCGVEVRENTSFCYNCGISVVPEPLPEEFGLQDEAEDVDPQTKAALDDLAERLKKGEEDDEKLAKAAAERRKARVKQRKPKEYTWEPEEEGVGIKMLVAIGAIILISGVIVFLLVFWK